MIVQMFLLVIPTIVLMLVSILAYGPIWGGVIILAAVFSASTVGYFIGHYFGERAIYKLLGEKTENKIESFTKNYGFYAVVITRLNPILSNDAISFAAGILKMNYCKFIAANLTGILPLTIFLAIAGRAGEDIKTYLLVGSIINLLFFGLYIYWRQRGPKKT